MTFSLELFPRFSLSLIALALMALGLFAQPAQAAQAGPDPIPPADNITRVQTAAAAWRAATPLPTLNLPAKRPRDANLTIAPWHVYTAATAGDAAYSLADAMRDAVWRKQTAAMLRSLVR